jgi:hypothetical protein
MDKKMSDALSVTFNGNVTFQGPMFDIHDNGKVVIVNGRSPSPQPSPKWEGDNRMPLPKELDTPRARTYFAKAVRLGYMEPTDDGKYRWIGTGKKPCRAELAYFLGKVYNYKYTITGNAGENFPEESLNSLFGATRLYSSLTQVYNAQKPQRWRSRIDAIFE